jgi:hypothetical protein
MFWSAVESVCREIQATARAGHDPFTHNMDQDAARREFDLVGENVVALLADLECYLAAADPLPWADRLLEAAVNRGRVVWWLYTGWGGEVADFRELGAVGEACRLVTPFWEGKTAWPLPHAAAFLTAAWGQIRALSSQGRLGDAPEEPAVGDWREARNAMARLIAYCRLRGGEWLVEWPEGRFRSNGRWRQQADRPMSIPRFGPLQLGQCDGGNTCPRHTTTASPQPMTPGGDGPATSPNLKPVQRRAYEMLNGKAFTKNEFAEALDGTDPGNLHQRVLRPLMERGLVRNDNDGTGYYRPDAPPPGKVPPAGVVSPR